MRKKLILYFCIFFTNNAHANFNWPKNYFELFAGNLRDDLTFRLMMIENSAQNIYQISKNKKDTLLVTKNIICAATSLTSIVTYPSSGNWSSYENKYLREYPKAILALKLINAISSIDATLNYIYSPAEIPIRGLLCCSSISGSAAPFIKKLVKLIAKYTL